MPRENTIGVVQWEALQTGFDGERFLVIIPAFFQSQHVPYLGPIISARVTDLDDKVSISLNPGCLTESGDGTSYEPGSIVLAELAKPWPDAATLRVALEAAFVEAGEIEQEQRAQARELEKHLRSAPRPLPPT
jgi:hypothetical protein